MYLFDFYKRFLRYLKRKNFLLNERYWYISLSGKLVEPHLMFVLTDKELYNMCKDDFLCIARTEYDF